ncbi:MAG: type I-E CRISPR-associated protein Cse1/CasA, partial [Ruminococcus sp.]
NKDCSLKEVSLNDLFLNAHEYAELAGETKTQDMAVLRLLLAVVHTVFSRYDLNGDDTDIESNADILFDNWAEMWKNGKFPSKPFEKYFSEWHERFWLFDEGCI